VIPIPFGPAAATIAWVADDFVKAYWEFQRLSDGDREERLASEQLFWTYDSLCRQIDQAPLDAVRTLEALADAAPEDEMSLVYLGTGPVEDLLSGPSSEVVDAVDGLARRNERFRVALSYAVITDPAAAQLRRFRSSKPG
jgi:hypothetical protein